MSFDLPDQQDLVDFLRGMAFCQQILTNDVLLRRDFHELHSSNDVFE